MINLSSIKYPIKAYLNIRKATSPSFSHDGTAVVFLLDVTGTPQIWRVSVEGGWPEQLTYYDERIREALCSPTGKAIAFATDRGGDERDQIYLLSPTLGVVTPIALEPGIIHGLGPWAHDGTKVSYKSNARNRAFFDIYIADVTTEQSRRVWEQDGANSPEAWSHDDARLLVKRMNTNLDSDFYLIDLKTREPTLLTPHHDEASYSHPAFTPDDQSIVCLTNRDREFVSFVSIEIETGKEEAIVEAEHDIDGLAISVDGGKAAFTTNEEGYSTISILDLATRRCETVKGLLPGVVNGLAWSPDGAHLAFGFSGSRYNSDIWLYQDKTREVLRLTKSSKGGIPPESFVEPELIRFPTFDERILPAFLYKPKRWKGETPPVVLQVHGGPESQSRPSFNPIIQYLVNQGFAVLSPNVRGSRGYGKEYVHL
ncbi:MAG: S9 family peptidase, partial [Candidatus Bathyarchaeota archaeon]